MRFSVGLMPASRSLATRALIAGYILKTDTEMPMTEPMPDNTYVTICQTVVPVSVVGVEVPSGQLCEEEQGRQVDSEVWPVAEENVPAGHGTFC